MKPTYSSTNKHLSRDEIIRLVKNTTTIEFRERALNHIQNCALCNEAVEGIKLVPDVSKLQTLNASWKVKTGLKKQSPKLVINMPFLYPFLLLAALIAVVIIYFFFFL